MLMSIEISIISYLKFRGKSVISQSNAFPLLGIFNVCLFVWYLQKLGLTSEKQFSIIVVRIVTHATQAIKNKKLKNILKEDKLGINNHCTLKWFANNSFWFFSYTESGMLYTNIIQVNFDVHTKLVWTGTIMTLFWSHYFITVIAYK